MSADDGRTWRRLAPFPRLPVSHGASPDPVSVGKVQLLSGSWFVTTSSYAHDHVEIDRLVRSDDGGRHWADVTPERCPGPGSHGSVLAPVRVGRHLVTSVSCSFESTTPLSFAQLWASTDDGRTWRRLGPRRTGLSVGVLEAINRTRAVAFARNAAQETTRVMTIGMR